MDTTKANAKLSNLVASFDELEEDLEPLFAESLSETLQGLEPIQQAKLQTLLPYLVYDLVFIYLKTKGVDPKTHPVIPELDRIRSYFEKIKNAESSQQARSTVVDKEVADRFIKHAIAQSVKPGRPPGDTQEAQTTIVPAKVTSKMLEREQYLRDLKKLDEEGSEEGDLEVFGEQENASLMQVDDGETFSRLAEKRERSPSSTPKSRSVSHNHLDHNTDSNSAIERPKSKRQKKNDRQRSDAPSPSPGIASRTHGLPQTPRVPLATPSPSTNGAKKKKKKTK